MGRTIATSTLLLAFGMTALGIGHRPTLVNDAELELARQQGGNQGPLGRQMDGSIQAIDQAISGYLNGEEIKSILTPGEFNEWTLNMKAGQVLIAEANSEAFDPAIEIVDGDKKVMASNDDRYPGYQRPLLLWRCAKDGTYALHVQCFHNKSGGQFFLRFHTYDSVDLVSAEKVEKDLDGRTPFLLRGPMKAGQIKEILSDTGGEKRYMAMRATQVISETGLPDINLSQVIPPISGSTLLIAPVAGDYYVLVQPFGPEGLGKIRVWTREIAPTKLVKQGDAYTATAPTRVPVVWELPVKAGEFLEASTPELEPSCRFVLAEAPDVSKFDVKKPEANPFFPQPNGRGSANGPAFETLSGRARAGRITNFYARRDATLWLASNGGSPVDKQFTLRVRPAAADFTEARTNTGKLR